MPRMIKILFGLGVLAAAGVGGGWLYFDHQVHSSMRPSDESNLIFEVPKGASMLKIGKKLKAEGLIKDVLIWRLYLKKTPLQGVKAGRHNVSKSMNIPQLLTALSGVPLSEDVSLTMVEGWRLKDADEWLSAHKWIKPGEYLKACSSLKDFKIPFPIEGQSLEGYLLPETYRVSKGKLDVGKLIQRQIDAFNERFHKPHESEIKESKRSLSDIVIMASMLEREEPKSHIRPMVAGILYKRLDAKTPLGVDATSRYLLEDWSDRRKFLAQLRNPDDPYNTRRKTGLPPTAIGAPGLESLVSALRPKPNPYWYYLHDADQNIRYGRNGAEHEANRKKYNVY
jgi:UPF0755 protein